MKRDSYIFDKSKDEFVKLTYSVSRILKRALKYFLITASLAVVYYVVFALLIDTDTEKKLRRQNKAYKEAFAEMEAKERLVGDVLQGLAVRDRDIYHSVFQSAVPAQRAYSAGFLYVSDTIPERNIVKHSSGKLDRLSSKSDRINENFRKIEAAYSRALPPLSNPLGGFSLQRTGASVGKKLNPFLKVSAEHDGFDLLAQQGDSVYAASEGVVRNVTRSAKGKGNVVEIEHSGGYVTRYAHLEAIKVSKGQRVAKGKLVGVVGMSGNSFAPHLHYEVYRNGERQDPVNYMFGSLSPDDYSIMMFLSANTGQSMD